MKKTTTILVFLAFFLNSLAECYYTSYELTFSIKVADKQMTAYKRISACDLNLDSIGNTHYLIMTLQNTDFITLYENRIDYSYCYLNKTFCPDENKGTLYILYDEFKINVNEIIDLKIIDNKSVSSTSHISSQIQKSDTIWLNTKPIEAFNINCSVCSFIIIVHKMTEKVRQVISSLDNIQSDLNKLNDEELILNETEYLTKIEQQLNKIKNSKVVTITSCGD